MSICTVDDCTRDARKRGWCSKHYQRWLRHGNTDSVHDVGRKPEPALWVVTCPDCEATVGVVGHQAGAWDVMARHLCNINERKSSMTRYIYTAAYITVIVAANWATSTFGLVPIGFGLAVTAGTFFAGLALIVRDGLQLQVGRAWMLSAIAAGALISAVTSEPAIALASGIAFAVSELVDWGIFTPLRPRSLPGAVVASSIVSAPVDTVLFLAISGFGVTWQAVLGQFLVKTGIALLVALGLAYRDRQAVPA